MSKQTKTVSIKGYVTYRKDVYNEVPFISFTAYKPTGEYENKTVVIKELTIEVEIPVNFDPRSGLIANLEAQQRKAAADFQALTTSIMRQISELQALEMS